MLKQCDKVQDFNPKPLDEIFADLDCHSTSYKMSVLVEEIKSWPINGCITGSFWLPVFDPDGWGTIPDIDVFVYSERDLIQAIDIAMYGYNMKPGKGKPKSTDQEEWKLDCLRDIGLNKHTGITTYSFYCDGVIINITHKQQKVDGRWIPLTSAAQVLESFDMSIVMQAYDIKHDVMYDMRVGDPRIATPNPVRTYNTRLWTVAKWIRQFDRVIKYYNRGYDTRPMAEFYLMLIDDCLAAGCLFDSEAGQEVFETMTEEFKAQRDVIASWLEEHKED